HSRFPTTTPLLSLHYALPIFERLLPADESGPGAIEMGIVTYLDRALAGAYQDKAELYRLGLAALDRVARERYEISFVDCSPEQQDRKRTRLNSSHQIITYSLV